jgi:hypothetical protein
MITKVGDTNSVLLGCSVPFVLRATENGQYKVVGGCYVCGLMGSEALLGSLPEHVKFVWRFDEGLGYWPAYIDRGTGEALVVDPKLGPLPAGRRRKSHNAGRAYSLFAKDGDSIDTDRESDAEGTRYDPRLTAEALAERNLKLTAFEPV